MKRDLRGRFSLGPKEVSLEASLEGGELEVRIDGGAPERFSVLARDGEVTLRRPDGRIVRAFVGSDLTGERGAEPRASFLVWLGGRTGKVARAKEGARRQASAEETALEAPMPGTCREVFVTPGAKVEKGARLLLVEAMKMEHEIRSPRAATVKSVNVKKGDAVSPGSPLVELQ